MTGPNSSPPHDLNAEQAVLGGLMLCAGNDGEANGLVEALSRLTERAFYAATHQRVFRAINNLHRRSEPPDLLSVTAELRREGKLDDTGGAAYVTSLLDATPGPALLPAHVGIVADLWKKRELIEGMAEISLAAQNGYRHEELLTLAERVIANSKAIQFDTSPKERGRGGIELAADLLHQSLEDQPWFPLWEQRGFIGPGLFTLLSGHAKVAGKSTAMSLGIRELALTRSDLRILILTEEPRSLWRTRLLRWGADLPNLRFWAADGTPWAGVLAALRREEIDLLVVDTLRSFAGITDENDAAKVVAAVQPLVLLARTKSMGVLALHHLRKSEAEEGLGHAGSTALVALADVALELRRDEHAETRRVLRAVSRFDETPRALALEKREDDIFVLGAPEKVALEEVTERVLAVLPASDKPGIDREEVREALGEPRPSLEQTTKALRVLQSRSRVAVEGKGKRGSPYLWRLPEEINTTTESSSSGGIKSAEKILASVRV